MPVHGTLLSGKTTHQTPEWFLEMVRQIGPIMLDPATAPDNPTDAKHIHTQTISDAGDVIGSCGLRAKWAVRGGLVFINPPYGPHLSGPVNGTRPPSHAHNFARIFAPHGELIRRCTPDV